MEVINDCREVLADWEDSTTAHGEYNNETVEEACACCDESNEASSEPISRRWIRVHHITNNVRIKQIVTEAQDLKLGGYLKAGYPGVVVLKMLAASSLFGWIKGNKSRRGGFGRNLGHHVRGETTCAQRQLPEAFEQLEDDMGSFGALCKGCTMSSESSYCNT